MRRSNINIRVAVCVCVCYGCLCQCNQRVLPHHKNDMSSRQVATPLLLLDSIHNESTFETATILLFPSQGPVTLRVLTRHTVGWTDVNTRNNL